MKHIWIINHHALTPDMGGGTRHFDFAKELIKKGYKVTIIASSYHYSKYQEMKVYPKDQNHLLETLQGVDLIWIKTPPYKGNGFSRVKNMFSFMFSLLRVIPHLQLQKPDTIVGSSVHLFAVYGAYVLSKKYKAKFIMEVRDLWPKTLIDMGFSKWHPFIILLGWLEKFLYKRARSIITNLPLAHRYIERFTDKQKIHWISNGVDLSSVSEQYENKLDNAKFNVLYAGAHGMANDLERLVEVAYKLKQDKTIYFTLIGDGALKASLIQKSETYGLTNIQFLPSVSKDKVQEYLKSADLLYVGLKNLPLYKYGMSMNKVFDYMAAKKPILFVSAIEHNIVDQANCGEVIKTQNLDDTLHAIKRFSTMAKTTLETLGNNGYNFLIKNYDTKVLAQKFEEVLQR